MENEIEYIGSGTVVDAHAYFGCNVQGNYIINGKKVLVK